jgi:hypothetical protein
MGKHKHAEDVLTGAGTLTLTGVLSYKQIVSITDREKGKEKDQGKAAITDDSFLVLSDFSSYLRDSFVLL